MKNDKIIEKDKGFVDDAIVGIINLCHGQVHAELEYMQSGDSDWLDIANECRKDRSELLDKIIDSTTEKWCMAKHTLIFIGIYQELGARCLSAGNKKLAEKYYKKASKWLKKFYKLNKI